VILCTSSHISNVLLIFFYNEQSVNFILQVFLLMYLLQYSDITYAIKYINSAVAMKIAICWQILVCYLQPAELMSLALGARNLFVLMCCLTPIWLMLECFYYCILLYIDLMNCFTRFNGTIWFPSVTCGVTSVSGQVSWDTWSPAYTAHCYKTGVLLLLSKYLNGNKIEHIGNSHSTSMNTKITKRKL